MGAWRLGVFWGVSVCLTPYPGGVSSFYYFYCLGPVLCTRVYWVVNTTLESPLARRAAVGCDLKIGLVSGADLVCVDF